MRRLLFVLLFVLCLVPLAPVAAQAEPASAPEAVVERSLVAEPVDEPYEDPLKRLLDHEARAAAAEGDYATSRRLFERLVRIDPKDDRALRELGRVTMALGDSRTAAESLEQCWLLRDRAPDPELNFIWAEALTAEGRTEEAREAYRRAENELLVAPESRQHELWMARIYAQTGRGGQAAAIYQRLLREDPDAPDYREVQLQLAESYIIAGRTGKAKEVLERHLLSGPDQRATDMLAWVLELRGEVDEEVAVRKSASDRWDGQQAPALVGYARSLERADRTEEALARYQEVRGRGNGEVDSDIRRLRAKLTPEVMAESRLLEDPTGSMGAFSAGASVPLGGRIRFSSIAEHTRLTDGETTSVTSLDLRGSLGFGQGHRVAVGATPWHHSEDLSSLGALAVLSTDPSRRLRALAKAHYDQPWRESALTIRELGSTDAAELQLYAVPLWRNLTLVAAGRLRALRLGSMPGVPEASASQALGSAGLDWIIFSDYERRLRGHILGERLLLPSDHSNSLSLSYRHYEVATSDGLGTRVFLFERNRVDEISATGRHNFADSFGAMAQAGIGNDWLRDARLWRLDGQLLFAVTERIRLAMHAGIAREVVTTFTGERVTGGMALHADL